MLTSKSSGKIKIGILIDAVRYGGLEKIAINQVKALRKAGHHAVLLVLRGDSHQNLPYSELIRHIPAMFLDDELPPIFKFSFKFPLFYFFSLFHLTYPLLVVPKLSRRNFDLIISHGTYACFAAVALSILRGIPYIAYIWDPAAYIINSVYHKKVKIDLILNVLRILATFIDYLILRTSRAVIISSSAKTHFGYLDKLNASNRKVTLIYPFVDASESYNPNKEDFVLLVTAWKEGKNPELLLEIAKRVKNIKFLVAGAWISKDYMKQFLERIKNLGLEKRIIVTGSLPEEKLRELYRKALVFLQLKADTGFGLPALEAAASGCTFIIPDGQGVCDLFEHCVDGYFIKEGNIESIVNYLSILMKNREKVLELSTNAWLKVKQNYSLERHAEELLSIILEAIHLT